MSEKKRSNSLIDERKQKLWTIWKQYANNDNNSIMFSMLASLLDATSSNYSLQIAYKDKETGQAVISNAEATSKMVEAVGRLINLAFTNSKKLSSTYREQQIKIETLQAENKHLKSLIDEQSKRLERIQDAFESKKSEYEALKKENADLSNANYKYKKDLEANSTKCTEEHPQKTNSAISNEKIKELENRIENQNFEISMLEKALADYERVEKQLLPSLRKTLYTKKVAGKSITLSQDKIKSIVKRYLKGETKYKIAKDLNISKSCVRKVLSCEYKTYTSCKRILNILHDINGHWTESRKEELQILISLYETACERSAETKKDVLSDIKAKTPTFAGYLAMEKSFKG